MSKTLTNKKIASYFAKDKNLIIIAIFTILVIDIVPKA